MFDIHLICLIPCTVILVGLLFVFRPSKSPTRFVPIYVIVSGLFFAIWTAFLILDFGNPTPVSEVYNSSGCCGTELGFLIGTPLFGFGVLALGGMAAYAITRGLHLETTSSQITVALLTGSIMGTLIGVVLHFRSGNLFIAMLALTAIAIVSGIVILIRNKKSGSAGKGNAMA